MRTRQKVLVGLSIVALAAAGAAAAACLVVCQVVLGGAAALVISLGGVSLLIVIGVAVWLDRSIVVPLQNLKEIALCASDGKPVSVKADGSTDDVGTMGLLVQEIGQMAKALQVTTVEKSFLGEILGSMADHLVVADPRGNIVSANLALLQLLGCEEGELAGTALSKLVVEGSYFSEEESRRLLEEGVLKGLEKQYRTQFGLSMSMSVSAAIVYDRSGQPEAIVCLAQDITERKRIMKELEEAKDAAVAASEAKSQFLAHMSHEIRTPLSAMIGVSSLLRRVELPERGSEYAEMLVATASSLRRLVDGVLDLSKIEAGMLTIDSAPFHLHHVIDGVVAVLSPSAQEAGTKIRVDLPELVSGWHLGDPQRLHQVLVNLLGNAVKFTRGGSIRLTAGPSETRGGDWILFSIRDTGIGISPDKLSEIFMPFTQEASSTRKFMGGTGLGLTISRRLVELMGGELVAESEVGVGSCFWFEIPLPGTQLPKNGEVRSMKKAVPLAPCRLLVVEDHPVNRLILERFLVEMGHEVDAAQNGQEALKAIEKESYDLVFMDCQMPEMDGYEATRRLRAREGETEHLPVIAVTAHALEEERQKCFRSGMDDYLAKPYTDEELFAVLRCWLPARVETPEPLPRKPQGLEVEPGSGENSSDPDLGLHRLDLSRLEQLQTIIGVDGVDEAIEAFVKTRGKNLDRLARALAAVDPDEIWAGAHTLKGSSAMLGLVTISAFAKRLEESSKSGSPEELQRLVAQLSKECDLTVADLARWRSGSALL